MLSAPFETDVAVVGAGPAGRAAAAVLAGAGARVLAVDERGAPAASVGDDGALQWSGATAWHLTEDRTLWVSRRGASVAVRPRLVILATGAMERPFPLPGWTLPGVFGAAGLLSLMMSGGLVPDRPVVLIGGGDMLRTVSKACHDLGVMPVATLHAPSGCRMQGEDSVTSVSFLRGEIRETIECGIVGLHAGFIPSTQFARLIGCRLQWNAARRCFQPVIDAYGNSSVPQVMIAGDAASVEGEAAAASGGAIAGWDALRQLGRITPAERDERCAALRPERHTRSESAPGLPDDDVIVCRCEEITAGQIRAAARQGVRQADELKGLSRCGMGPCQGRTCGPVVAELIAAESGLPVADVGLFRVRVPLKPIAMREMAQCVPA